MKTRLLHVLSIALLTLGLIISAPLAVASECSDFSQFEKSTMTLVPYTLADFQMDLPNIKYADDIKPIQNQLSTGNPAFQIIDTRAGFDPDLLKFIVEKGRDIAVFTFDALSSDAKNWRPVSRDNWDFQENPEKIEISPENAAMYLSQSEQSKQAPETRPIISRPTFRSGIYLMRLGLTPGKWGARGIEISVKGCPTKTIYTKRFQVPQFELDNFDLDKFIDNEARLVPTDGMNYLSRRDCAQTLESLKKTAVNASAKSANWSLPPTQSGNLNMRWKISGESICYLNVSLKLSPALGDRCLKKNNPGGNAYSYQTMKYPCLVAIDASGMETVQLASFTISKPSGGTTGAFTTCVKGSKSQKILGANAKCPVGYTRK